MSSMGLLIHRMVKWLVSYSRTWQGEGWCSCGRFPGGRGRLHRRQRWAGRSCPCGCRTCRGSSCGQRGSGGQHQGAEGGQPQKRVCWR
eukprot:30003_3